MGYYQIDMAELGTLTADLRHAAMKVQGRVRPLIKVGAIHIKQQMRDEMGASSHFKGTAAAIDFDIIDTGSTVTAEIGPKVGSGESGGLGGLAYFGGSNGGGGTVPDPQRALEVEAVKVEKALGDIPGGLL